MRYKTVLGYKIGDYRIALDGGGYEHVVYDDRTFGYQVGYFLLKEVSRGWEIVKFLAKE